MITLLLDTTQARKSRVEINKDGKTLIVVLGESPLPTIDKALADCHLSLSKIDEFSSNPGPGSFTGVRIGAAVINTLNFALGKDVPLIEPIYD